MESLYILVNDKIHISELNKANSMLNLFVAQTEDFYGLRAMTYNLHQCLHVCKYVLNWGPLHMNSTIAYESANYYLLKAIKTSRGSTLQMVRYVNTNHTLVLLEDFIKKNDRETDFSTIDNILCRRVQILCITKSKSY